MKPVFNLNGGAILVIAAGALAYFAYRKIKEVDLNPFDKDGFIGKQFYISEEEKALYAAAKKALATHGKDIANYSLYKGTGGKLPRDSWKVTYKGKAYYYIPDFTLPTYNVDAGAGSYG